MTSKQRANLRAMASTITQSYQIGKSEISENQITAIDEQIEKRELIKISVLRASEMSAKDLAEIISTRIKAQVVAVVGSKIILYRRSTTDGVNHIEF